MALPFPTPASLTTADYALAALNVLQSGGGTGSQRPTIQKILSLDDVPNVVAATGNIPPWCFGRRGSDSFLLIAGVQSAAQAAALYLGSAALIGGAGGRLNANVYAAALSIVSLLDVIAGAALGNLLLCGHSYGGSLAEAVAFLLKGRAGISSLGVLTFGSPRPGDASFAASLRGIPLLRWMTDSDPVPRFPPSPSEAPGAYISGIALNQLSWPSYVQPGGGVVLPFVGQPYAAYLPPLGVPIAELQLLSWASGVNGFGDPRHNLTAYSRAISSVQRGSAGADPVALESVLKSVSGSGPIPAEALGRPDPVGALSGPTSGGEVVSVIIPVGSRPGVVKMGSGTYEVVWGSTVVARGMSKSNAKAFAKWLYKALRVLQTEAAVSIPGFTQAAQVYLSQATNPLGGFYPILGTL